MMCRQEVYRISQLQRILTKISYVDTLMILPDYIDQMMQLKSILTIFNASIGLKVNYHKTTLVPINIDT
jgi:hypothetical protein